MKVIEIRDEAGLQSLRPQWNALLSHSAAKGVFLTWEWMATWWSVYGTPGTLRVLAAYGDDGELAGIAPLRRHAVTRCGQTVEAVSFIGDLSCDSDYLDFIIARGREDEAIQAFERQWARDRKSGAVLLLNEIPDRSPVVSLLRKTAAASGLIWKERQAPCGTVPLPATWDEYLTVLKPRFRSKVRSVLRSLEEQPEIRFGICENREQVAKLLPALFDLHTRRWSQESKPGVFGWELKRRFYSEVSGVMLERDALRLSWLEWNGHVLACQYGVLLDGVYSQLQEGYDPACEHRSVGVGLRAWSIREYIRQGIREYDFLSGMGRHKTDWGAELKFSRQILLAADTWKNRLFANAPEWVEKAKSTVRRVVPEQPEPDSAHSQTARGAASDWFRRSAAALYLNLGLPCVVRPVRERYHLAAPTRGRGLSCVRRREPSARILYYHRVNDDQDPFFSAMSTALFEQQIRYVAKHYRVVTLGRLVEYLSGESPEPVVAVTFDDGYQDNFQQAFPILKRYGVPATIFLATGSMDTREPVWFERLAQLMKRTSREYVDVEIDIPRRLRTRTVAERLTARDQIYAVLRKLPHWERERWVDNLVRSLGTDGGNERRDKMLTWDQVRLMAAHGIEFGGHTVTHPFLSTMARDQVAWEVSECKRRIEEETQRPAHYFAYPSGREEDFGQWNEEAVKQAGYKAAVTTIWGVNYPSTNRMELRRGGPWEDSLALYACKLDWYQFRNG